jgi:hypothetical protein
MKLDRKVACNAGERGDHFSCQRIEFLFLTNEIGLLESGNVVRVHIEPDLVQDISIE